MLVFREAYHGGVLEFSGGGSLLNVPFDYALGDFNDCDSTSTLIRRYAEQLAAVIVEPILGAGGNIPGTEQFLGMLRSECDKAGALLVFDEVKTSRCAAGGIQGALGIRPDLTTLGKYLGGGLPSGAFGGRNDVMERFDHRAQHPFKHAGTFNNNVCSMMAGYTVLTKIFTPERANEFARDCENFRLLLNDDMRRLGVPIQFTGSGSLIAIHFALRPITTPKDIPAVSKKLGRLFHMEMLLRSILVAARGDIFISLPVTSSQLDQLRTAVLEFVDIYRLMIEREISGGTENERMSSGMST